MQISPQMERLLHDRLPIDEDEKILNVFRHHWFIYVMSWGMGLLIAALVMGVAIALTMAGGEGTAFEGRESQVLSIAAMFSLLIVAGSFVPVYLRVQEQLVLTEESLLQMLQPSLFASKVDQLSLQHIADVSVRQDFFGSIFGYGHLTIETPGEQNNFHFVVITRPDKAAREIMAAHEDYIAALEGGYMPSHLADRHVGQHNVPTGAIDPEQYKQFLAYQQMLARQQQEQLVQNGAQHGVQSRDPASHQN